MTMTQGKISSFFSKQATPPATEQGPKRERQEGGDEGKGRRLDKPDSRSSWRLRVEQ